MSENKGHIENQVEAFYIKVSNRTELILSSF